MKKRGEILVIGILIILILEIYSVSASEIGTKKINSNIYEKFEKESKINVLIKIENTSKNNNEDIVVRKVNLKELKALEEDKTIKEVLEFPRLKAFLQDSVPLINANEVWNLQIKNINITGSGESVCIIDSGIDFTHPDLFGKNKTCVIDCFNKECVENCSIGDDNGHGTHIAGIVAASGGINGIGIDVGLIGLKVLDENGNGSNRNEDLRDAINWCIANKELYNISIISMSLGTDCDLAPSFCFSSYCDSTFSSEGVEWTQAINNATSYNISVIIATGNNGNSTLISAPACIQNAIAVSATDKEDNVAIYSNYNSITDFFAPGSFINSTKSNGGYVIYSGTSMSAPHVAGAFALFSQFFKIQENKIPLVSEIVSVFNETGAEINTGSDTIPRIDVYSAIISLLKNIIMEYSPENNFYINEANQNNSFICNSTSSNSELKNITFSLFNFSELIYNESLEISGLNNNSEFFYNFTEQGEYKWNCEAYNIANLSNTIENHTITYDTEHPIIDLISPSNASAWSSSNNVNFYYNVSDVSIANCSLIVDNEITQTNSSVEVNTSQIFTGSLINGDYNWSINCTDSAGNINNSETRELSVNVPAQDDTLIGSNSPGGGGGSSTNTYNISYPECSKGYTKELNKYDKIIFTFFDETYSEHTLTIEFIGDNFVNLTIQSEPIKIMLGIGQSAKLNISSKDYYNIFIKLEEIINGKAKITLQSIREPISNSEIKKDELTGDAISEEPNSKFNENYSIKFNSRFYKIFIGIVLICLLFIILLKFLLRKKKTKKIKKQAVKEYKKRFKKLVGKDKEVISKLYK